LLISQEARAYSSSDGVRIITVSASGASVRSIPQARTAASASHSGTRSLRAAAAGNEFDHRLLKELAAVESTAFEWVARFGGRTPPPRRTGHQGSGHRAAGAVDRTVLALLQAFLSEHPDCTRPRWTNARSSG